MQIPQGTGDAAYIPNAPQRMVGAASLAQQDGVRRDYAVPTSNSYAPQAAARLDDRDAREAARRMGMGDMVPGGSGGGGGVGFDTRLAA